MPQVNVLLDDLATAIQALRYTAKELLNTQPIDQTNNWTELAGNERMAKAERLEKAAKAATTNPANEEN